MIGTYHVLSLVKVLLVLAPLKPFEISENSSKGLVSFYNLSMADGVRNYKNFLKVLVLKVSNDRILVMAASNLNA